MKKFRKSLLVFLLIVSFNTLPLVAFAQNTPGDCALPDNPKLQNLFDFVSCVVNNSIIPLIFTLAVAFFIYGVVQFMLNDSNEEKREKGKQYMVWGIIALTVMVSVWGLVKIVGDTVGVDTGFIPKVSPN